MKKNKDKMEIAREILALIEKYNAIDAFGGPQGQAFVALVNLSTNADASFDKSIRYNSLYNLNESHGPLILKIEELELACSSDPIKKLFKFWTWFRKSR